MRPYIHPMTHLQFVCYGNSILSLQQYELDDVSELMMMYLSTKQITNVYKYPNSTSKQTPHVSYSKKSNQEVKEIIHNLSI